MRFASQPANGPVPETWQFVGWREDDKPGTPSDFRVDGYIIGLSSFPLPIGPADRPTDICDLHVVLSSRPPGSIHDWRFCAFQPTDTGGYIGRPLSRRELRHTRLFHFAVSAQHYRSLREAAIEGRKVWLDGFLVKIEWTRPEEMGDSLPFRMFDQTSHDCPVGVLEKVRWDGFARIPRKGWWIEGCELFWLWVRFGRDC